MARITNTRCVEHLGNDLNRVLKIRRDVSKRHQDGYKLFVHEEIQLCLLVSNAATPPLRPPNGRRTAIV